MNAERLQLPSVFPCSFKSFRCNIMNEIFRDVNLSSQQLKTIKLHMATPTKNIETDRVDTLWVAFYFAIISKETRSK